MFKLRSRARKSHIKAATKLIGEPVRGYGVGFSHFRMTTAAWVMIGIFGAVFVVGLLLGVILFPSVILGLAFFYQVRPRRAVAVTDKELVVMSQSFWTSRPRKILMHESMMHLNSAAAGEGGKPTIKFGDDSVSFHATEFAAIVHPADAALRAQHAPAPAPVDAVDNMAFLESPEKAPCRACGADVSLRAIRCPACRTRVRPLTATG